tara:strand:- start:150 stop:830 length:681 start_codon:yes stop_codon:yes gene_type:complete
LISKFYISEAKGVDDQAGIVEAYVNTMGVKDADGDVIDPEAFDSSIRENLPIPVLSGHDQSMVVGKVLFAQKEQIQGSEHRLFARMQMNMGTEAGRDAYSNVAGAFVREWSVGFNIPSEDGIAYERGSGQPVRHILDLDWVEVSSVVRGASPSTMTIAAKADTTTAPIPEVDEPEVEPIPETEPGADMPDEPDETAPDTDPSASDTAKSALRLLQLRLELSKHEKD